MTLDDKVKAMGVDIEYFTPSAALAPAARIQHLRIRREQIGQQILSRLPTEIIDQPQGNAGNRKAVFPGELLSMEFRCKL